MMLARLEIMDRMLNTWLSDKLLGPAGLTLTLTLGTAMYATFAVRTIEACR